MKKDIEWLKKEVNELPLNFSGFSMLKQREEFTVNKDDVLGLIDQLDEQEVLSQEWIDRHTYYEDEYDFYYADPDELKNLLVPKQEITEDQAWDKIAESYPAERVGLQNAFEHFYYAGFMTDEVVEKPVIPKFVADWIEEVKPDNSLRVAFEYIAQRKRDNHDDELAFWVEEGNSETFARAWLDGYEVEEEQKYLVSDNSSVPLLIKNDSGGIMSYDSQIAYNNSNGTIELTEQEIKDYDPRYMAFAKPVEELEE